MARLVVKNGFFLSSEGIFRGHMTAEDGIIVGLSREIDERGAEVVDAAGRYVMPGAIDSHCHIGLDTGIYRAPDTWDVGTRCALLGGVTTVVDFASPKPGQNLHEATEDRLRDASQAVTDYHFHISPLDAEEQTLNEAEELAAAGSRSLKLYTTYRPNYYLPDREILSWLELASRCDLTTLVHCENDALVTMKTEELVREGKRALRYHAQARPAEAEWEACRRLIIFAGYSRARLIVAHNSHPETTDAVVSARSRGKKVYCESAPQYMLLDEELYERGDAWRYILQPPLRDKASSRRMSKHFGEGHIDMMITDHCGYSKAQKTGVDDFTKTPGGLNGLQTLLPLTLKIALERASGEEEALKLVLHALCEHPAKIYGFWGQKGKLQSGFDADFVILERRTETIDGSTLYGGIGYSPFEGMTTPFAVHSVYKGGRKAVENGELCEDLSLGRYLRAGSIRDF